ncbi:hypothetical protein [Altererythrobacter sp. Z27]|uniref:hypothetical protein n=1 Tax=Altererythrobacter sp. Z27 TaxID=3461147 RepID=UPI004043FE13
MSDEIHDKPTLAGKAAKINGALAAIERQLAERDEKIADLEQRLEDQEYSVRRVLDMLIEWLEDEPGKGDDKQREAA